MLNSFCLVHIEKNKHFCTLNCTVDWDLTHHGLVVVLYGHGDHVDADDEGDKEVQVVVSAQCVDVEPGW